MTEPSRKEPVETNGLPTASPRPGTTPRKGTSRKSAALADNPEDELDILIRARYPIIYVTTWEEERVEACLRRIADSRDKKLFVWTITQGIVRSGSDPQAAKGGATTDPLVALDSVMLQIEPAIYLFKDFHHFTQEDRCNLSVHRRLRDVAHVLRDSYKSIVITSPLTRIATELSKDITLVDFGLPGTAEFGQLLDKIVEDIGDNPQITIDLDAESREKLLRAARGLTLREAENVFAKTLVKDGRLCGQDISQVFSEKQQIIRKSGLLEYYDAREKITHVAGLENLKDWLVKRSIAFTDRAKQFGLPAPRGVLLLGVQGCGKSLCAKAIANLWKIPLLRFDIGRMFSSLVGSSEENIRRAIQVAESVAPAILWIDEIDKALAGAANSGSSDGGTGSRVFGTLLTWLSEKTSPVFVVATANDISHLPPELLRKGRLDEIFFVDLPSEEERRDIFRVHLARRSRKPTDFDVDLLAKLSDGFSGAEIEESIIAALFEAFSQSKPLATDMIADVIRGSVPLSKTMHEELDRLRNWASGRSRPASGKTEVTPTELRRKIEF